MALDAITGRPFTPTVKGQRTAQKIDFDPAAWQEQWNLGEAGDVGGIEAGAIQSIKDALAARYEGNQFYSATSQDIADHWAAENAKNMGTAGYQEYIPTQAELARTGDVRLQDEASRIFREQMMGGYNPNIDYRAEGVTPNVFLRSGEGLGGWEGMGRPTVEQPGGVPLGYGVPKMPSATQAAAVPAAAPTAAPAAAPASTRRLTSADAAAGPAPATQQTAQDAIDNVQVTLGKQNKAIQGALQSGLIDISDASKMWDTQRQQIYKDFVDQYGGATDQYATEDERIAGKRSAERTKILADLDMRGVDASMVGEELSILDALVGSQTNANVDYMSEIGDIAGMADVDRKWLGEGIFGDYEQDLRSQMRNLGLGLEIDSATAEGERLDQALSSNALAEYLGVPASTLMGGMVGGVDLPGMAYGTSEREAGQDFASGEALLGRDWQSGEAALGRDWQSGEAALGRGWQSGEALLGRDFATQEREAGQTFTGGENALSRAIQEQAFAEQQRQFDQGVRSDAAADIRGVRERAEDVAYRDALLAADETAATQAQENWQSTYNAGMMGVDTREYISEGAPMGGGVQTVRNPMYGMTPSQQAEYTLDLTAMTQVGATETDTFDNLMRYLGQTGDATLTSEVLGKVAEIIATDPGMMTKGPNADTTLYALGVLANTEVENAEGEITFPYRDIFFAVQNLGDGTNQQSTAGGGTAGGGTAGGGTAGGAVDTLDLGPAGYSTGAGNLSESEIMNQDLVDLILEEQKGYGSDFEWGTGASGAVGDVGAGAGKAVGGAAASAATGTWGAMQGDSYTSSSGTEYGSTQLEQIANSAIPPGYTVQQWIEFYEERGKKWGLKSDGRFGWE